MLGYHDAREIPNYWTYANQFVLQDHLFEPTASWSLPQHLFMVSEWSAICRDPADPMSCTNEREQACAASRFQDRPRVAGRRTSPRLKPPDYAWTDLTYLLHAHQVSWGYYIVAGPGARL